MFTLNCKGQLLSIEGPVVMGILNITPDSFYAGSRLEHEEQWLHSAEEMIEEGATILDIGGQSTRPGSERVDEATELARVVPAIAAIHRRFPHQVISVDTFYASVAIEAIAAGASIVNDISAGSIDPKLLSAVAQLGVPYVLMHMLGEPQTMQQNPHYQHVTLEVFDALSLKIKALHEAGINDIIVDPGFGFGKTIRHNFQLLRELHFFKQLDKPIMVGLSRKSTVWKTLGTRPENALNGSTVLHTMALMNGASILRVHDVKEAVEVIKLWEAYRR
jgi:dihydropteroate synthase